VIYRRDDGQLACREHPAEAFGDEPLGKNLTSRRARRHLMRAHPTLAAGLKGVELVRVPRPPAPALELPPEGRRA
jgi:hypothetical protein